MHIESIIRTAVTQNIEHMSAEELYQLATDSYQQIRESHSLMAA